MFLFCNPKIYIIILILYLKMRPSRLLTALLALTLSVCGPSPQKSERQEGSEDEQQTEVQPTPSCDLDSICGDDECSENRGCGYAIVCAGDVGERICIDTSSVEWSSIGHRNGVPILETNLDEHGRAAFQERNKDELAVIIGTNVKTGRPARSAIVTYVDGNDFEGFFFGENRRYSKFLPSINIFAHNSAHQIQLVPRGFEAEYRDLTMIDYIVNNDQQSDPLINYLSWAQQGGYVYEGCKTREQLQQDREYSMMILSLIKGGPAFKLILRALENVSTLEEMGIFTSESSLAYHIYAPVNFTAPQYFEGFTPGEEIENNHFDDNCDGEIDEEVRMCTPNVYIRCTFNGTVSGDFWFNSCHEPQLDQMVRLCDEGCSMSGECYQSQLRDEQCGLARQGCDGNSLIIVDDCGRRRNTPSQACPHSTRCRNGECVATTDNPAPTPDPRESPEPSPPLSRFEVRDNGRTVYDRNYNRHWLQTNSPTVMTFDASTTYCETLGTAGRRWRVPTFAELSSLDDSGDCEIPPEFNLGCGVFWSNVTCEQAWRAQAKQFRIYYSTSICRSKEDTLNVTCIEQ